MWINALKDSRIFWGRVSECSSPNLFVWSDQVTLNIVIQMHRLSLCPRVPKNYVDLKWLCISHSRLVIFSLLTVTMCFLTHTLTIFYFLKPQSFPNQNHAGAAMCTGCRKAEPLKNACLGAFVLQLLFFLCPACWLEFHSLFLSVRSKKLDKSDASNEQRKHFTCYKKWASFTFLQWKR